MSLDIEREKNVMNEKLDYKKGKWKKKGLYLNDREIDGACVHLFL